MAEGNSFNATFGSAGGGGSTEIVWGSITGTLSNQTDLQNALDDKVSKSDYTPAKSLLVQQSGTGSPSSLSVGQNTLIGRANGGSSEIEDLSVSEVKDLLGYAEVNPTSTFLPINESDSFVDSPIFATKGIDLEGYNLLETKINDLAELPVGGIEASQSWGLSAELNFQSNIERVQLGDFDGYTNSGKFEWSKGGIAPFGSSYIQFDTYDLTHFLSSPFYFQLDANTGNPTRVDGALYDTFAGLYGFGKGLDSSTGDSQEGSLWWNVNTGDFAINGYFGGRSFYANDSILQTYIQSDNSKLGINATAMYITDDLTTSNSVGSIEVNILRVRDDQGNIYGIKLYPF